MPEKPDFYRKSLEQAEETGREISEELKKAPEPDLREAEEAERRITEEMEKVRERSVPTKYRGSELRKAAMEAKRLVTEEMGGEASAATPYFAAEIEMEEFGTAVDVLALADEFRKRAPKTRGMTSTYYSRSMGFYVIASEKGADDDAVIKRVEKVRDGCLKYAKSDKPDAKRALEISRIANEYIKKLANRHV